MNNYQYYAFISYSHQDARVARWLHRKLEGYRLPSEAHNELDAAQRYLRPIFRDTEELNTGLLGSELRQKLEQSKYLIVICSSRSACSQWVNDEVRSFIEMGRQDRIIPLMLEASTDCFPKSLRDYVSEHPESELLGVSLPEVGRSRALLRIVSRMLDVSFDSLWKRNRRLRIRRCCLIAALAVLFAVLALVAVRSTRELISMEQNRTYAELLSELTAAIDEGDLFHADSLLTHSALRDYADNEDVIRQKERIGRLLQFCYVPAYCFGEQDAVVSPDAVSLALISGNGINMLSLPGFSPRCAVRAAGDNVIYSAFSADGKTLYTFSQHPDTLHNASGRYSLHLIYDYLEAWDVYTGERLYQNDSLEIPSNSAGVRFAMDESSRYLAVIGGQKIRFIPPMLEDDEEADEFMNPISRDRLQIVDLLTGAMVYSCDMVGDVIVDPYFVSDEGNESLYLCYQTDVEPEQRIGSVCVDACQGLKLTDEPQPWKVISPSGAAVSMKVDGQSVEYQSVRAGNIILESSEKPTLLSPYSDWAWHRSELVDLHTGEKRPFFPEGLVADMRGSRDATVLLTDHNVWFYQPKDSLLHMLCEWDSIRVSRSSKYIAYPAYGGVCIMNPQDMSIFDYIPADVLGAYQLLEVSDDGMLLTYWGDSDRDGSRYDSLQIYDPRRDVVMARFEASGFVSDDGWVVHLTFSSDLRYCALMAKYGKICIFDTQTGELLHNETSFKRSTRQPMAFCNALDFIPGSHRMVIGGNTLQIFDVDQLCYIRRLGDAYLGCLPEYFSVTPDGKRVLLIYSSYTQVYDLQSGHLAATIEYEPVLNMFMQQNMCYDRSSSRFFLSHYGYEALLLDLEHSRVVNYLEDYESEPIAGFFSDDKPVLSFKHFSCVPF